MMKITTVYLLLGAVYMGDGTGRFSSQVYMRLMRIYFYQERFHPGQFTKLAGRKTFTQAIFAAIFLLLMHAIKWIDLRLYYKSILS